MSSSIHGRSLQQWLTSCPVLSDITARIPTLWLNGELKSCANIRDTLQFNKKDIKDASDRLDRFAPYIANVFPDTSTQHGRIESPLQKIPRMLQELKKRYQLPPHCPDSLFIKLDNQLPISGSIKARGGIYEVLKFAETVALESGLLKTEDNYLKFDTSALQQLLSNYSVVVGSTGNLGLSIGIISAKLGLKVTVHMSADAKQWKKEMLREKGVTVIEHQADYSIAVAEGRKEAEKDAHCHFVDDESSRDLFLGYAVAGERVKQQLHEQSVTVDKDHPLLVYLPCGVGGGPGGVSFGLKMAYGDAGDYVHCFFGEPCQAPAMLVGLATGLHDSISAQDLGVENRTIADGLAVSRPSGLVCQTMHHLLSGIYTVEDDEMYRLLSLLAQTEDIHLEPSAVVGFSGVNKIVQHAPSIQLTKRQIKQATHLVWATGGGMVPEKVWQEYHRQGLKLLQGFNPPDTTLFR